MNWRGFIRWFRDTRCGLKPRDIIDTSKPIPPMLANGLNKLREGQLPRLANVEGIRDKNYRPYLPGVGYLTDAQIEGVGIEQPVVDPRAAKYCRVCGGTHLNQKCAYCMKERAPYQNNVRRSQHKGNVLVDGEWFNIVSGRKYRD